MKSVGRPRASIARTLAHSACLTLLGAGTAQAAGGGSPMPWDTPLQNLLGNPTARALILIAIVACRLLCGRSHETKKGNWGQRSESNFIN